MNTRIKEISSLPRDFGAGLRMIRRNPRFAMLVIGTIALGIGVNTAMLSVVDAVWVRPMPFPEAGRIVHTEGRTGQTFRTPPPGLQESPVFAASAVTTRGSINLGWELSERLRAAAERRFAMTTMLTFGGLGFVLAIVGLYGVIDYLVRLRRRDIGIRMALGATPARVRWQVFTSGARHAVAGVGLGIAGAWAVMTAVSARVPGLSAIA